MTIKVGINGFGRIGRLALRAAFDNPALTFVHINDPAADATTHAHLLNFDSVHGRWSHEASADGDAIVINGQRITFSHHKAINDIDWSGCDIVIEASGKNKTVAALQAYLDQGVKRVVVSAPVKEAGALNIVMGVNDHLFDPAQHRIVTAASCTTNCIAPVIKVIHEKVYEKAKVKVNIKVETPAKEENPNQIKGKQNHLTFHTICCQFRSRGNWVTWRGNDCSPIKTRFGHYY